MNVEISLDYTQKGNGLNYLIVKKQSNEKDTQKLRKPFKRIAPSLQAIYGIPMY